jgi:uncharacterized protein YjbI with pentapeptide repeats
MARNPRLSVLRRTLVTRRTGWVLAIVLAFLGILLGTQQLTRAADLAGQVLGGATRTALDTGWLLLLLVATGLVLGLGVSSRRGRAVVRCLQDRLTTRPVRWTAAALGVLVLLVLVVVVLPPRFTAHRHFDKAADELKAQNDVRTTLLQALAGAVLATGAYLTFRQLQHNIQSSREEHDLDRQGQITERFTHAIDQLGTKDQPEVVLGGIYALGRIAHDSDYYRPIIAEILATYVRTHAPWSESRPDQHKAEDTLQWRAPNVQAALAVLGDTTSDMEFDLRGTDLHEADLKGAKFKDVRLYAANLQRARLRGADLRDARLDNANLWGAQLQSADLQGAQLERAILQSAHLRGADLRGARLDGANFQGADLRDAQLDRAILQGTRLRGADLQRARLNGANFQGADLQGARLDDANFQGADLRDARLNRAILQGARLQGADLQRARLKGANFQKAQFDRATLLRGALADGTTTWPDGFDFSAAGVVLSSEGPTADRPP